MRFCTPSWKECVLCVSAIAVAAALVGAAKTAAGADAGQSEAGVSADPSRGQRQSPDAEDPQPPATAADRPSEAEAIARLQRAIAADRQQLEELVCEQNEPNHDYDEAKAEFERLDAQRAELGGQIEKLEQFDRPQEAKEVQQRLAELEIEWKMAKERFDLAIRVRKAQREKVTSLQEKLEKDTLTLEALTKAPQVEPPEAPPTAAAPSAPAEPADPRTDQAQPPAEESQWGLPLPPIVAGAKVPPQATPEAADRPPAPEVLKAKAKAQAKLAALDEAEQKAKTAAERLAALKKNIAVERELLDLARAGADQAQRDWMALHRELQTRLAEDPATLEPLTKKIDQAAERLASAQGEAAASQQRLDELRAQMAAVQQETIETLREADAKRAEFEDAQQRADHLQNPLAPANVLGWLDEHGLRLAAILLGTLAIYLAVRVLGRHLAKIVAHTSRRGTRRERENRALTLVGVFRNVALITVIAVGMLMLLDELGIPIVPLMGGAAVVGLAVAFGAQNLVRDYFGGFMVLLEDQYGIGDVVKIGDIAGAVEQITLRVTVLRDLEGIVHFVPHGSITTVSNMTHGWSRALLDIGVAYKEDADRVMEVMLEVAAALRDDETFGPLILGDPEMLGVDSLGDSAVVIKMCVKTQPLKRWAVKRELLRRIKARFDALGIEIPFPHRTLYLRHPGGEEAQPADVTNGAHRAA